MGGWTDTEDEHIHKDLGVADLSRSVALTAGPATAFFGGLSAQQETLQSGLLLLGEAPFSYVF